MRYLPIPSSFNYYSHRSDKYYFAVKCYTLANILQNDNTTDIPITVDFYQYALTMINSYSQITSNPTFNAMLSNITNDLNTYHGMTISQILSAIQ